MGRYKSFQILFPMLFLVISCGSAPKPAETEKVQEEIIPEIASQPYDAETKESRENAAEVVFDPASISQEYYESTREDVRHFIDVVNGIIKNHDYSAWVAVLSPELFAEISSDRHLEELSELPAMKTRRITLKNAEDYFTHVVVPSRANSRVDDIEFINLNRVKAFTVYTNRAGEEQRLLLYNLEKSGEMWKIIS